VPWLLARANGEIYKQYASLARLLQLGNGRRERSVVDPSRPGCLRNLIRLGNDIKAVSILQLICTMYASELPLMVQSHR